MIKLQIVGNLGKDCIVNEVNGKTVINFSVAHTDRFKDAQGNIKDKTYWVECAYWTDRTNVAKYLTKGKTVYVEGTPEADAYINREGKPAGTLRMRVRELQLIGGNSQDTSSSTPNYNTNAAPAPSPVPSSAASVNSGMEDDLPF